MNRWWIVLLIATSAPAQRIDQLTSPRAGVPRLAAVTGPVLVRTIAPDYAEEARSAGLQGIASLYLEVDPGGNPSKIKVLHGLGLGLDEKAVQALQQWQFRPAMQDGKPVSLGISANISFDLDGGGPWRIRLAAYH